MNVEVHEINAAVEQGGEQYWRKIYYAFFVPLKVFIMREFAPMPEDVAEELSCKTLLKLVNSTKKPYFDHIRQFTTWLYKAARSTSLDYLKSCQGKAERSIEISESLEELSIEVPLQSVNASVTDIVVQKVLSRLSDHDQKLLYMRANGTPYKLIAEELDIKENAARTYFDRAKKKFKQLYAELREVA